MQKSRRPNSLILMVDQLAGTLWPAGPADFLHTPHLDGLAERSLRFRNSYTPSPLCMQSRPSFLTVLLPSSTGAYDHAAQLPAEPPTFAYPHTRVSSRPAPPPH